MQNLVKLINRINHKNPDLMIEIGLANGLPRFDRMHEMNAGLRNQASYQTYLFNRSGIKNMQSSAHHLQNNILIRIAFYREHHLSREKRKELLGSLMDNGLAEQMNRAGWLQATNQF